MSNSVKDDLESIASKVNLTLLDPLGKSIAGLKYQIKHGAEVIAEGVTDGQGKIAAFTSEVGKELAVHVERFTTGEMKQIKTVIPWAEQFAVKLLSGKVKHQVELKKDAGAPGAYKRKTHTIQKGDTLGKIAAKNSVSVEALAALNGLKLTDTIFPGMTLKIPPEKGVPAAAPKSAPATTAQATATPPAQASSPAHAPTTATHPPTATAHPSSPAAAALPPAQKSPPRPIDPPISTKKEEHRGESGTPKTTINLQCDKSGCIKIGDKGALVEEINIRLSGFGGTASGTDWETFTDKTEKAVKQFQRDYMGAAETGKVCGTVLKAIDEFTKNFPVSFGGKMKCQCGKCSGFGTGLKDSTTVDQRNKQGKYVYQKEYPGIHKSLIWILRSALFYTRVKEKSLGFNFHYLTSGYRCWIDNKNHDRASFNHMGHALDIQFKRGKQTDVCMGKDLDELRKSIFMDLIGAQMRWDNINKAALEATSDGAKRWVHIDIRTYADIYKKSKYYATNEASAAGDSLVDLAKKEGRLALANCGGIAPRTEAVKSTRVAVDTLSPSKKIIEFIKGYEAFDNKPYNCSAKVCTIGWGHVIDGKNSCKTLEAQGSAKYNKFKSGITKAEAEELLKNDVEKAAAVVRKTVHVPLHQQEFDALVSLAYNTGSFKEFPGLRGAINSSNYAKCCYEFGDITNGGEDGLVKRRKAEMNIFSKNIYDSTH